MSNIVWVREQERTQAMWLVADLLEDGLGGAVVAAKHFGHKYFVYQFVLDPEEDLPFLLVSIPDGPPFACLPVTDESEELLLANVPGARRGEVTGVAAWAATMRWKVVATVHVRRIRGGGYESYDPRWERR